MIAKPIASFKKTSFRYLTRSSSSPRFHSHPMDLEVKMCPLILNQLDRPYAFDDLFLRKVLVIQPKNSAWLIW